MDTMPIRLTGRTALSESVKSWFESTVGSDAAAHGCGSALVSRMARVGTGWRLHVLVLQPWQRGRLEESSVAGSNPAERTVFRWVMGEPADPLGFDPRASRFDPWAPSSRLLSGNGKHVSLVRRQSGFDSPGRLASSTCGCSSVGQSISMPRRGSPVQIGSAARMRLWWNLADTPVPGTGAARREGSTPSERTMESEPVRVLGVAANDCAGNTVVFE